MSARGYTGVADPVSGERNAPCFPFMPSTLSTGRTESNQPTVGISHAGRFFSSSARYFLVSPTR